MGTSRFDESMQDEPLGIIQSVLVYFPKIFDKGLEHVMSANGSTDLSVDYTKPVHSASDNYLYKGWFEKSEVGHFLNQYYERSFLMKRIAVLTIIDKL